MPTSCMKLQFRLAQAPLVCRTHLTARAIVCRQSKSLDPETIAIFRFVCRGGRDLFIYRHAEARHRAGIGDMLDRAFGKPPGSHVDLLQRCLRETAAKDLFPTTVAQTSVSNSSCQQNCLAERCRILLTIALRLILFIYWR